MTIDSRTLYATLLGLKAPWEITDVELKQPPGEVHIRVALPQDTLWVCPQCYSAAPIHDHQERRWRYLDTCQYPTIVHARVPRLKCPTHGIKQLPVPWSEAGSRFRRFSRVHSSTTVNALNFCLFAHESCRKWYAQIWFGPSGVNGRGVPIRTFFHFRFVDRDSPSDCHCVSKLRNRVIGRIFNALGLIEQWGSGIQRMAAACRAAGLTAPFFEGIATRFRVTIATTRVGPSVVDETDAAMLKSLGQALGLATSEVAEAIRLSPRAIRTRLARLVGRGLVREIDAGPQDPQRRYFLAERGVGMTLTPEQVARQHIAAALEAAGGLVQDRADVSLAAGSHAAL